MNQMLSSCSVITTKERQRWLDALKRMDGYDFYHLPQYHQIAERRNEGKAYLFTFSCGDIEIIIPLLKRNISSLKVAAGSKESRTDFASVYGYAGALASQRDISPDIVSAMWESFSLELEKMNAVTVFIRLHPLFPHDILHCSSGKIVPVGETVAIDLSIPFESARSQYRKSHRRGINKLIKSGVSCIHDANKVHLEEFIEIYTQSMHRVQAPSAYLFDKSYFESLTTLLDPWIHLFVCKRNGAVLCGGLYSLCNGIVQAHLGGVCSEALRLSPTKLETETVHRWACEQNARLLHLGGGVGAMQDSLLEFKAGFSSLRYPFSVWQHIVDADAYAELCEARETLNKQAGLVPVSDSFFPPYRCPSKSSST